MKLTRRGFLAMPVAAVLPVTEPPKRYEADYHGIWQVTEITHYATRMDRRMLFQYTLEPVGLIGHGILHHVYGDHGYSDESGTLGWCMGYQFKLTIGNGYTRYSRVNSMGLMRDLVRPWNGEGII